MLTKDTLSDAVHHKLGVQSPGQPRMAALLQALWIPECLNLGRLCSGTTGNIRAQRSLGRCYQRRPVNRHTKFLNPRGRSAFLLAGQRRARGEPQNSEALLPKLCLFGRGTRQQGRRPCLLYRPGLKVPQRGLDTAMPGQRHGLGEGHVLATSFGHES